MKLFKRISLIALTCFIVTSCFNDDIDDNPATNIEINDFVWQTLNLWYFWQGDVPDLSDEMFTPTSEYENYLRSFDTPEALFNDLKFADDRFSIIIDDYNVLINSLDGVSESNGMEFGLARIDGGSELLGYVQYVLPNTDAEDKGVIRGNFFRTVDGTDLNETNFRDLLFSDANSYTIGLADIIDGDVITNGTEITLERQVYTENPIFKTQVFDEGGIKIGYIMYNSFNDVFDQELNNVFADFASQGVQELILDVRYNLGGQVRSAVHLSSMITGQFTGQVFLERRYNDKLQELFADDLTTPFVNAIAGNSSNTPINSLNLNRVYILAQGSSASASELVINCLEPYIDVIHIGGTTVGKNEFSTVLLDIPECGFLVSSQCDGTINPTHTYGLLPLIGRSANADGFFEYTNGLNPDIEFPESLSDLGVLGTRTEPLLERAIQEIAGGRSNNQLSIDGVNTYTTSRVFKPTKDAMILDFKEK